MTEFLVELAILLRMLLEPVLLFVLLLLWGNARMAAKRDDELGEAFRRVRHYLRHGERGENRWLTRIAIAAFIVLVPAGLVLRIYG